MKNVVLISNIPNPYRIPLFNELSAQLSESGWDLTVIFGGKGYDRRKFILDESSIKFKVVYLESRSIQVGNDNEKTTFNYKGLSTVLNTINPEVVITNGFSPATVKVWAGSFFKKYKYLIWSGAIMAPGRFDSLLRKMQRKLLIKRASGFIVYGSAAKEYLLTLGADASTISVGINTVDTTFFKKETNRIRQTVTPDIKKHLTFTGYLVKRKKVEELLACIQMLGNKRQDFVLDIIGDGEDRKRLEAYCDENKINHLVKFHGFIQKEELPGYMAVSSGFLFQTNFDIWGLVLNEAMAAGLCVLSSPNAGATRDLIAEGITGFVVDFSNHQQAVDKISWLLDHPAEAAAMGKKGAEYIDLHASPEASAKGFAGAITGA
ncbi:MAG TPA: glycosyltransferase family 4 protein [Bacteroidia bacterium]|nr:glycosyltransferase family 4 protein [Bacteroidia bacterium]